MLCHFIVCFSLYRTVKLHLYVCWYYGLRLSNLIKETTYLLSTSTKYNKSGKDLNLRSGLC